MKLSIHYTQGKSTAPNALQAMGRGWVNIDVNWAEAFELITVDGYANSAELQNDHRIGSEFVSRQLLMVDVDNDTNKNPNTLTIPELLQHPFYEAYGAGFYATHSFQPDHHKFRICFVLEQPETDASRCRKIIRGLLKVFPAGDTACVDPVRLFYGNINCQLKECRNLVLPGSIVQNLVEIVEAEDAEMASAMTNYNGPAIQLDDAQKQRILDLLKQTYVGSYPIWRNVGWGLKAGGFTVADFQYVTTGMMSKKSASDAAKVWNDGGQVGKPVTMGSVIHLLKERHGKDCLRDQANWKQEREAIFNKYVMK